MIPYKEKPNGMIKHTAVLLILLCFSGSCFSFLQESRRRLDSPFSEYHRRASLKDEPRKIVNHEREVIVLSPYIRDVGADSRQSRIDARDIRTDFREIRTELGTDTSHRGRRSQSRRFHDIAQERREGNLNSRERRSIETSRGSREVRSSDRRLASSESRLNKYNERTASNHIRFREQRDTEYPNSDRLSERRDSKLGQEFSRRNSLNNIRSRETRDNNYSIARRTNTDDSGAGREYRLNQEDSRFRQVTSRERSDELPNTIRFREVRNDDHFANRRTSPYESNERREYRFKREDSRRNFNSVTYRVPSKSRGHLTGNNVRTREYRLDQEASRSHSNDIRFRESGTNEYSAERRTSSGDPRERRGKTLDQVISIRSTQFRTDRENSRKSSERSRPNNIREREIRSTNPNERIDFRSEGESSRRYLSNNIRSTDRRASSREENARTNLPSNISSRDVRDKTRKIPSKSDERSEPKMRQENSRNNIRLKERYDGTSTSREETSRRNLLRNVTPCQSRQRRELRTDQEDSRRLSTRMRSGGRRIISSGEQNEHRGNIFDRSNFRISNNRRTTPRSSRERRDSRENLISNIRYRRTILGQDREAGMSEISSRRILLNNISDRRASRSESRERLLPQGKIHYSRENSDWRNSLDEKREGVEDTIRIHDHKKNDTGSHFTRNTGNTRVAAENNNFTPSFNYKSSLLITAAQAALVMMLFGQILGNASKNKLRLTNWRAIFSKEKIA